MLFRSPSAASSSSKIGSDTTYFSLAQLPPSCIRQRSQQNGTSLCILESVSALQIGHLCFMVCCLPFRAKQETSLRFSRSVTDSPPGCAFCASRAPDLLSLPEPPP